MAAPRNPGSTTSNDDPFDSLLDLEDNIYTSAYELGVADGAHAGRIEGRIFGLEKGFEKFASMGELHGRACVWGSRLPSLNSTTTDTSKSNEPGQTDKPVDENEPSKSGTGLPVLKETERLRRNIFNLHGLTDPLTFSTLNTEDAVADFDDRFKRAGAKAKIIERTVSESERRVASPTSGSPTNTPKKGRTVRVAGEEKKKKGGDDSMEDFSGSRFLA